MIEQLVEWESTDERVPAVQALLADARYEIARSVARARGETAPTDPADVLNYLRDKALPIYDPFAGGGSIPLEAQRLGLKAIASDLNPVAVLINKALIELPPKFKNRPPVNPKADDMGMMVGKGKKKQRLPWRGTSGLADDIRYYGRWMRDEAFNSIGHLYPKAALPDGSEATVIAWLWARTIPCPNPACGVQMPLLKTFQISKKSNNEHWIKPVIGRGLSLPQRVSFVVQNHNDGVPEDGTVNRHGAVCVACNTAIRLADVREQARDGKMGEQMTAIVVEGDRRRIFVSPNDAHIQAAISAEPAWRPSQAMPNTPTLVSGRGFGITHWHQLFTQRQLLAITTFSDLIADVRQMVRQEGGNDEYANTVCTYLSLVLGRTVDSSSSYATWQNVGDKVAHVFARQAIPMVWDFAEVNIFSTSTQNWMGQIEWVAKVVERLPSDVHGGVVHQADASTTICVKSSCHPQGHAQAGPVIVTDPPYYDNIDYADLSDFFYVWLRRPLREVYPDLFAGILTPKGEEITAIASRFEDSRQRFEALLNQTLKMIRERCSNEFPSSIFYAYKQQEEERGGRASTGWETMLSAIVSAGFEIVGTWPMRTERPGRSRALNSNALASSIVLVCRSRPDDAEFATRREFFDALARELPAELNQLTREGHIAPTDLAQAAIGPGMRIYSRYSRVATIGGELVPIREALAAINRVIAHYHDRQEGELDAESRFCFDWLKQHGYATGQYGEAETLARAKDIVISNLQGSVLTAEGGQVRLLPIEAFADTEQLPDKMTAWEACFRMAFHMNFEYGRGIEGAADVGAAMRGKLDSVERMARILYNYYDHKGDSENAVIFNDLVAAWRDIRNQMARARQGTLFNQR
jgi:putative DNA methylase